MKERPLFLRNLYVKFLNRVPNQLLYHKDYFFIQKLLQLQEKGVSVENQLNIRLAIVLKKALINVPYYRKLNLNINPDEINAENAIDILHKFPFLDKKTVMENYNEFISDEYRDKKIFSHTSGGSTGQGIKIWHVSRELHIEQSFFDHKWGQCGYKKFSKIVRIGADAKKKEDEDPCFILGDKLYISPYHFNQKWLPVIVDKINNYNEKYIHGYPSNCEILFKYLMSNHLILKNIKAVFLASERVSVYLIDLIKKQLPDSRIIFHYGMTEKTNLAWGFFQDNAIHYKMEKIYGFSENYKTNDGRYEIVGTSYWNEVFPLIRYRTQDFGQIDTEGIIQDLNGRDNEFLISKQGTHIPGFSISIDQFTWDYVEIFQVIQNEKGIIEFHLKPKESYTNEIEKRILNSQQSKWGNFFDFKIILEEKIERTRSGKMRLVINNIKRSDV